MLQYDDTAFNFFALSIATCVLIPSWCTILTKVVRAWRRQNNAALVGAVVRTSLEQKKADELKKEYGIPSLVSSNQFRLLFVVTLLATSLFLWLLISVATTRKDVNVFDPYAILEIDRGADQATIKKAYYRLARLLHPDKQRSRYE